MTKKFYCVAFDSCDALSAHLNILQSENGNNLFVIGISDTNGYITDGYIAVLYCISFF